MCMYIAFVHFGNCVKMQNFLSFFSCINLYDSFVFFGTYKTLLKGVDLIGTRKKNQATKALWSFVSASSVCLSVRLFLSLSSRHFTTSCRPSALLVKYPSSSIGSMLVNVRPSRIPTDQGGSKKKKKKGIHGMVAAPSTQTM